MVRYCIGYGVAGAITGLSLLAGLAIAQQTPGPSDTARYTFHRMEDGFIRLDVQNGQVSQCSWAASGWFCRVMPDERMALESEIARLQASNTALKKELLAHDLPLPQGVKPDPSIENAKRDHAIRFQLPTEADFDQMVSYAGKVWRRLVDMMGNLQRDMMRKS